MAIDRPKYLFNHLDDIRDQLREVESFALFLDLDGTLAGLMPNPRMVKLKPETRAALETLAADPRNRLAIVSGRRIEDVRNVVGLPGIIYAGNHGLEISGLGLEFVHDEAGALVPLIQSLAEMLQRRLSHIPGALVEFKNLTASIHYRLVASSTVVELRRIVAEVLKPFQPDVEITMGRKVLEIRPTVAWHKGTAVQWILSQTGYTEDMSIYVGDDRTDEDAFGALTRSITIHVGTGTRPTNARFFVRSPDGVLSFLQCLPAIQSMRPRTRRWMSAAQVG